MMSVGEALDRWGVPLIVTTLITGHACSTALRGPHPIAIYPALVIGALWAWHGHHTSDRAVSPGSFAQALPWDPFVRPHTARSHPTPSGEGRTYAADRGIRGRLRPAARTGTDPLALPLDRHSHKDARATEHRPAGHVQLDALWFHPQHTRHLPPVLEHELSCRPSAHRAWPMRTSASSSSSQTSVAYTVHVSTRRTASASASASAGRPSSISSPARMTRAPSCSSRSSPVRCSSSAIRPSS